MDWLRVLASRLSGMFAQNKMENELDEELRGHVELMVEENMRRGMPEAEARRIARLHFGGVEQAKESYRKQRGLPVIETLIQDLRYGLRLLLKNPGFTLVAVVTLALGIGANTAIFSVVNAVLLRPLPFPEPARLLTISAVDNGRQYPISYPAFFEWKAQATAFEKLAAHSIRGMTMTGTGDPARLRGLVVTADLFPLLGVAPTLGREFLPEDEKPGAHVVILSESLWRQRFGGSRDIIGRSIMLDGDSFIIVGVMPSSFNFPIENDATDLWTTVAIDAVGSSSLAAQRGNVYLDVIGRLKPTATQAQAQAELETIVRNIAQQYPATDAWTGVATASLTESLVGQIRRPLWILYGAVFFVLLISGANVASLLLARAMKRYREIAIRSALGATRWRIMRQLLIESLLLALIGGIAGLMLAAWGLSLLIRLAPQSLPHTTEISIDPRVLAFTLLITLVTGIFFGLAPLLQPVVSNLAQTLKEEGRATGGAGHRWPRSSLVVAEIALSLILLVGAGLLVNSFIRLQNVKPGFDPHNVLTFRASLPSARYSQSQRVITFYQQLLTRIGSLPGVNGVSAVSVLPLSGQGSGIGFSVEGLAHPAATPFPYTASYCTISPGYFRTMGIQIVKGREFTDRDDLKSTPVVIVNESFARQYFPDQDPLGKRISPSYTVDDRGFVMREIIAVVADIKERSLSSSARPEIYVAEGQLPQQSITVVARTAIEPNSLIGPVRQEALALDQEVPLYRIMTLENYRSQSIAEPRFNTLLLAIFAGVALILASVGLYGLMSYAVTQRTHEIGIRIALGAQRGDIFKLVIGNGMALALIGVGIGLAASFALTRLIEGLLFGVRPTDPATLGGVTLLLAAVALLACYIPARRAVKVDPMIALRYK